jgi:hypothetical protein
MQDRRGKYRKSQVRKSSKYHMGARGACNHSGCHTERILTREACRRECNASSATDTFLQARTLRCTLLKWNTSVCNSCVAVCLIFEGIFPFQNFQQRWRAFINDSCSFVHWPTITNWDFFNFCEVTNIQRIFKSWCKPNVYSSIYYFSYRSTPPTFPPSIAPCFVAFLVNFRARLPTFWRNIFCFRQLMQGGLKSWRIAISGTLQSPFLHGFVYVLISCLQRTHNRSTLRHISPVVSDMPRSLR